MENVEFDVDAPLSHLLKRKRKARKKETQAAANISPKAVNNPEPVPIPATTENDMEVPIPQEFNQKKKAIIKVSEATQASVNNPSEEINNPEQTPFNDTTNYVNVSTSPVLVSEFNYSVKSHFEDIAAISKLCGYPETFDANLPEIKQLSNSMTFLREWRDFKYAPRAIRFAYQHNLTEKEVVGGITLPQFSSASVPKATQNRGRAAEESRDFVMNVGGAVWALDWCPRVDCNSENPIKSEFVAVAAHPPESSYHNVGTPLTGRGAIQIWCVLTVSGKEDVSSHSSKSLRKYKQKRGTAMSNEPSNLSKRGRPRKNAVIPAEVEDINLRKRGRPRKNAIIPEGEDISLRKRGRPIKNAIIPAEGEDISLRKRGRPIKNAIIPAEVEDIDSLSAQPLSVKYPKGSTMPPSSDRTSGSTCKHAYNKDAINLHTEQENVKLLTAPKVGQGQVEAAKVGTVRNNTVQKSAIENQTTFLGHSLDTMSHDNNASCIGSLDVSTSSNSIPTDVALPRMIFCLAHNGKVAWDVKWRPVRVNDPESTSSMGYLAVLLGNGALEVWEIPYPHIVKFLYPADQKHTDPRFLKLQPVFRCSMVKCGERQSIPLTVEWSVSSTNDLILAGCHDGVVALWKFSVTDSSIETRPLLSFSADTGPIRTLAWAPSQSDRESANIIVTASHKGFKFWDIRDPFRPLWDCTLQGVTFGLGWLPNPGCVFGSVDDGTIWLLSLARAAIDIPVTGKSFTVLPRQGFHIYLSSSFALWSVHTSSMTGMVAYCGEEGTIFCFKPTVRSLRDPSRHRMQHYLCGSFLEEESALIVVTPSTNSSHRKLTPNLKRNGMVKFLDKNVPQQMGKDQTPNHPTLASCKNGVTTSDHKVEKDHKYEVFPPKSIALHRARWNTNKGSERWLCYGGAAGLIRCQEVDISDFE